MSASFWGNMKAKFKEQQAQKQEKKDLELAGRAAIASGDILPLATTYQLD